MSKKRKLEPDDREQSARFVKTAKGLLSEDAEERFEEAIEKILPARTREPKADTGD